MNGMTALVRGVSDDDNRGGRNVERPLVGLYGNRTGPSSGDGEPRSDKCIGRYEHVVSNTYPESQKTKSKCVQAVAYTDAIGCPNKGPRTPARTPSHSGPKMYCPAKNAFTRRMINGAISLKAEVRSKKRDQRCHRPTPRRRLSWQRRM